MRGAAILPISLYSCHPRPVNGYRLPMVEAPGAWRPDWYEGRLGIRLRQWRGGPLITDLVRLHSRFLIAVLLCLEAPGTAGMLPNPLAPTAQASGKPGGPPACYWVFAEGGEPVGGLPSHFIRNIRGQVTALS